MTLQITKLEVEPGEGEEYDEDEKKGGFADKAYGVARGQGLPMSRAKAIIRPGNRVKA